MVRKRDKRITCSGSRHNLRSAVEATVRSVKRSLPILFCLIFILACNGLTQATATNTPAPTAVTSVDIPHATITYYDIIGSTENELRNQLDMYGPVGPDGYQGEAITNWHIQWTWDGYGTETCDLRTARTTYDIQVTMPRWVPSKNASPDLITKWGIYILALANHEKGHVDNVIANHPDVIDAIHRATCTTAEAKAQEVLTRIRQYDIDYDAMMDHGITQGARFP